MIQAIPKYIVSLNQVHEKFDLQQAEDDRFFTEWYENLPHLSDAEKARLDQIKRRYEYQQSDSPLLEETIKMLIVSPLLDIAEFYDPPFRFKIEVPVIFEFDDGAEVLQGRIDALVIAQQFWAIVVEAKRTLVNEGLAIPQTLAYMSANPKPERPVFGMITNGTNFIFLKLFQGQYEVSSVFSLVPRRNELYTVLKILKRIGAVIVPTS